MKQTGKDLLEVKEHVLNCIFSGHAEWLAEEGPTRSSLVSTFAR